MRPDVRNTSITIRLSAEEKEALEKYCKENDTTYSLLVRGLLKEYMKIN